VSLWRLNTANTNGRAKARTAITDPLRGIAALVVMAYHLGFLTANSRAEMPVLLGHGYLAVDLFFLLSGFVLMHVYGTTFSRQVAWADIRVFLWARFARLYPVHLLVLITMLPGYGGIPGGSGANLLNESSAVAGPVARRCGVERVRMVNQCGMSCLYSLSACRLIYMEPLGAARRRNDGPLPCRAGGGCGSARRRMHQLWPVVLSPRIVGIHSRNLTLSVSLRWLA
jgi:hypothetical protein